jgi:hypothetical protein
MAAVPTVFVDGSVLIEAGGLPLVRLVAVHGVQPPERAARDDKVPMPDIDELMQHISNGDLHAHSSKRELSKREVQTYLWSVQSGLQLKRGCAGEWSPVAEARLLAWLVKASKKHQANASGLLALPMPQVGNAPLALCDKAEELPEDTLSSSSSTTSSDDEDGEYMDSIMDEEGAGFNDTGMDEEGGYTNSDVDDKEGSNDSSGEEEADSSDEGDDVDDNESATNADALTVEGQVDELQRLQIENTKLQSEVKELVVASEEYGKYEDNLYSTINDLQEEVKELKARLEAAGAHGL